MLESRFSVEYCSMQTQYLPLSDVNSSSEAGYCNGLSMSWTHDYHRSVTLIRQLFKVHGSVTGAKYQSTDNEIIYRKNSFIGSKLSLRVSLSSAAVSCKTRCDSR